MIYQEISECRICGNRSLEPLLHLGEQALTGIFPRTRHEQVETGPLELVKCAEDGSGRTCGLVQLRHNYELEKLYGDNYGYRSGLNQSMVRHLHSRVKTIETLVDLGAGDLVIDIGSNDSTLLKGYSAPDCTLLGIDPTGLKFKGYYPPHIHLIPDFFSAAKVREHQGGKKARVITSISMFYDLLNPLEFVREIHDTLAPDGIWVFEQSYMPTMITMNSYDTICHEHLEYYGLGQIKFLLDACGMKIIDVEFNQVNGGSFTVTAAHQDSPHREQADRVAAVLRTEHEEGYHTLAPYQAFKGRVEEHKQAIAAFFSACRSEGRTVAGYGASTKGNVLIQYCGLTERDMPFIAEVNKDKFGCVTPGSLIPIVSEEEARTAQPGCFFVLPWHFRESIIAREQAYLASGGKLVFPLPHIEVV